MNDEHPTMEQSLHSIALSMINIHKELRDTRRTHKDVLRFLKTQRPQVIHTLAPPRRTVWEWLSGLVSGKSRIRC